MHHSTVPRSALSFDKLLITLANDKSNADSYTSINKSFMSDQEKIYHNGRQNYKETRGARDRPKYQHNKTKIRCQQVGNRSQNGLIVTLLFEATF